MNILYRHTGLRISLFIRVQIKHVHLQNKSSKRIEVPPPLYDGSVHHGHLFLRLSRQDHRSSSAYQLKKATWRLSFQTDFNILYTIYVNANIEVPYFREHAFFSQSPEVDYWQHRRIRRRSSVSRAYQAHGIERTTSFSSVSSHTRQDYPNQLT